MRHFGGQRREKLRIGWNWPFQVNLSLILVQKIGKTCKMTKIGHFEPYLSHFCCKIRHMNWDSAEIFRVFITFDCSMSIPWTHFDSAQKNKACSEDSVKIGQDSTEIFKFLLKFNQNCPFWAHPSHFGGKICHCGSFWVNLVWNGFKKLKNSKNLLMYSPPWNENLWDFSKNETL